jgi:hypothetical protein
MSSAYTTLLGFVLPVEGELIDSWGDVVNAQLTQLVEDSIAGYSTKVFTSGDLTWTLDAAGSGATNQARTAILIATGTPGAACTIYAPKFSKNYVVINNTNSTVYVKGGPSTPTTGVPVTSGDSALVTWDTSAMDFIKVAGGGGGATGGGGDQVFFENDLTVTQDYSIPATKNAGTFGPVSIASGVTVTIPSSTTWSIV